MQNNLSHKSNFKENLQFAYELVLMAFFALTYAILMIGGITLIIAVIWFIITGIIGIITGDYSLQEALSR